MSENTQSTSVPNEWLGKTEFDNRIKAFSEQLKVAESVVREIFAEEFGIDGSDNRSLDAIDSDEFTPFGDLRQEFVEKKKVAKLAMLRMAMPHLRGKTALNDVSHVNNAEHNGLGDVADAIKSMVAANRPKDQLTDRELLEQLSFETPEIAKIILNRTHSRPCIVFDTNGSVDVETSLELTKIAKRQNTNNEHVINGRHVRVYRAGQFPPIPLDESPFDVGVPLVSGYCASSGTSWGPNASLEDRTIARIHWQYCENRNLSKMELQKLCSDAHNPMKNMRKEYGKAALIYDEMKQEERLPTLKIYNQGRAREIKIDRAGM